MKPIILRKGDLVRCRPDNGIYQIAALWPCGTAITISDLRAPRGQRWMGWRNASDVVEKIRNNKPLPLP